MGQREIVINAQYGGFSLSPLAEDLYAKKSGFQLFFYKQTGYSFRDGEDRYEKVDPSIKLRWAEFLHSYTKDHGEVFNNYPGDETYWSSRDLERDDPVLVEVVKELGKAANGGCADLKIVEIPSDVSFKIEEYDGNEWVAETHRTWS